MLKKGKEARTMMSEINRADRAEALFREGYNCSQTVLATFADVVFPELSEAEAIKAAALHASAFGGGVGGLREVCGAVSGMAMVTSYVKGYSDPQDHKGKKALYRITQDMCAEFEKRMNSIICRDLLGLKPGETLPEPSVRTEEYYQSRPCIRACRVAAEITEEFLGL